MTLVDTKKALEYFEARLNFTTGPLELFEMIRNDEDINVIDVRETKDFASGHIPGAVNLPRKTWSTTLGLTSDGVNVVYSHTGACHLAAKASKYFAERGFPVVELEGGVRAVAKAQLACGVKTSKRTSRGDLPTNCSSPPTFRAFASY